MLLLGNVLKRRGAELAARACGGARCGLASPGGEACAHGDAGRFREERGGYCLCIALNNPSRFAYYSQFDSRKMEAGSNFACDFVILARAACCMRTLKFEQTRF